MCLGEIVFHPLGASSGCGFEENPLIQQATETHHHSPCPPSWCLAWNGICVSCFPSFCNMPPKLSTLPLRHAERACKHQCEGSPYHWLSTQMFLPILTCYWESSILIPATNQEMLPNWRPLSFSSSVNFSLM